MITAIAEMLIAGSTLKAPIGFQFGTSPDELWSPGSGFAECPSCYIVEFAADLDAQDSYREFHEIVGDEAGWTVLGRLTNDGQYKLTDTDSIGVEDLAKAWRGTLDW